MNTTPISAPRTGRPTRQEKLGRLFRNAPISAWFGMTVILIYALVGILAPILAPYGEGEIVGGAYEPMGEAFWLGTDQIGRDLLSRMIYGARNTCGIALLTTAISFGIGGTLGILTAYARGWLDQAVSRVIDVLLAIPSLIFALMLLAIFGKGVTNLVVILALLDSTRFYRLARASAMNVVVLDYVEAAVLRGESTGWIIFKEILPNISVALLTEFGMRFSFVFLTISALSFLGVGLQPPMADWGSIIAENKTLITYGNPTPLFPAAAIAILAIGVNFVVDWLSSNLSGVADGH